MRLRHLALSFLALVAAACDTATSEPCIIEADGYALGNILQPEIGDTLRLGEPFLFSGAYEAEGNEVVVGLRLLWRPTGAEIGVRDSLLYDLPLSSRTGIYEIQQSITIDSLRGGAEAADLAPLGTFFIGAYGRVRFADCGGAGAQQAGGYVPITVLD